MKKFIVCILCLLTILAMMCTIAGCKDKDDEADSEENGIERFVGTWETVTGGDDHYIIVNRDNTVTLVDGSDEIDIDIEVDGNRFYMEDEDFEYSFKIVGDTLIRYEDGEEDGYTYEKRD